mgnify:CR=1 FL=1
MQILNKKPPEWIMQGCLNQFRVNVEHTYWTYGDVLYNPGGHSLPDHIIAHEGVHARQQEAFDGGKDRWWEHYLINSQFRLEQEAEAYAAQYWFYCGKVSDRNRRALFRAQLAQQLSGPLYQLAVTASEARRMIELKA